MDTRAVYRVQKRCRLKRGHLVRDKEKSPERESAPGPCLVARTVSFDRQLPHKGGCPDPVREGGAWGNHRFPAVWRAAGGRALHEEKSTTLPVPVLLLVDVTPGLRTPFVFLEGVKTSTIATLLFSFRSKGIEEGGLMKSLAADHVGAPLSCSSWWRTSRRFWLRSA